MSSAARYRFLTPPQVKRLYARHVAKSSPSQPAMLESAVTSAMNHKHYGQADLFQLAGILAGKILLDHPFQDGNKRTALCAADMFLKINGHQLQIGAESNVGDGLNERLADAHVSVATGLWTSEDLGKHYAGIAKPLAAASREIGEGIRDAIEY